jgi:ABC-type amino acid transport substrate-binding protein
MRTSKNKTNRLMLYAVSLVLVLALGYLALAAVSVGNSRPATPVRLISGDWEPFVGSELEDNGPVARVVTETFQRMGYRPEVTFTSWDVILDQTSRVEVLGAFPFIASEERRERYELSDPILEFEYVLFYYRPHVTQPETLQTVEDFRDAGYRFGKVEGYNVWSELAAANFEFEDYPTREAAFQALVDGEIDFLPEGRLVGDVITRGPDVAADVESFGYLDASDNALLGASESLYLLLPKTDSARRLLDSFNEELQLVKETAVYDEALAEINQTGHQPSEVVLQPLPGEAFVSVATRDDQTYLVPAGSRGMVIRWPAAFESPLTEETDDTQTVTVKLLNGPLTGRVVQVAAQAVQLEQMEP